MTAHLPSARRSKPRTQGCRRTRPIYFECYHSTGDRTARSPVLRRLPIWTSEQHGVACSHSYARTWWSALREGSAIKCTICSASIPVSGATPRNPPYDRREAIGRFLEYLLSRASAARTLTDPMIARRRQRTRLFADKNDAFSWLRAESANLPGAVELGLDFGYDRQALRITQATFQFARQQAWQGWLRTAVLAPMPPRSAVERWTKPRPMSTQP